MKNGDKMRKNLAGHLTKKMAEQSSARDKQRRGTNMPVRPPSRSGRQDPVPDYLDNPLYLASDFQPPDPLVPAYSPPFQEGIPGGDILINVDPPEEPSGLPPITRRTSHGSFSTALDEIFNEPEPDSPLTPHQTEIVEEPDIIYHGLEKDSIFLKGKPTKLLPISGGKLQRKELGSGM